MTNVGAVEGLGNANAWCIVESAVADFGDLLPEETREISEGFVIRLHSDRDWELRLVPRGDLAIFWAADRVPLDRLRPASYQHILDPSSVDPPLTPWVDSSWELDLTETHITGFVVRIGCGKVGHISAGRNL